MTRKIVDLIGLAFFGLVISIFAQNRLEHFVQTLFRKLTGNLIHHYGTEFYGLSSPFYYLSFGRIVIVVWVSWNGITGKQKMFDGLLMTLIFFTAITVMSWLICSGIIIECDACEDEILAIDYCKINYNGIVLGSLVLSMIPSGLRIMGTKYGASA